MICDLNLKKKNRRAAGNHPVRKTVPGPACTQEHGLPPWKQTLVTLTHPGHHSLLPSLHPWEAANLSAWQSPQQFSQNLSSSGAGCPSRTLRAHRLLPRHPALRQRVDPGPGQGRRPSHQLCFHFSPRCSGQSQRPYSILMESCTWTTCQGFSRRQAVSRDSGTHARRCPITCSRN